MQAIPFPLIIIIIFAVQAIRCDLQCDVTEQLGNTCGTYCLQVVKPLLRHAKASIGRPDDKIDQILAKYENMEKRLDKVDQIPSKVESMEKRLNGYEQYFRILLYPDVRKIGEKYYYISTSREPFSEATKKCNQLGAHLVWITSSLELNLIAEHLTSEHYWINHWYFNGYFIAYRSWHDWEPRGMIGNPEFICEL